MSNIKSVYDIFHSLYFYLIYQLKNSTLIPNRQGLNFSSMLNKRVKADAKWIRLASCPLIIEE